MPESEQNRNIDNLTATGYYSIETADGSNALRIEPIRRQLEEAANRPLEIIRQKIEQETLPPNLLADNIFVDLLMGRLADTKNRPHSERAHTAELTPIRSNMQKVRADIAQLYSAIKDDLPENLQNSDQKGKIVIEYLIRKLLAEVEDSHFIRIKLQEHAVNHDDREFISPRQLKRFVRKLSQEVERRKLTDDQAIIKLLVELGMVKKPESLIKSLLRNLIGQKIGPNKSPEDLIDSINRCLEKGFQVFEGIIKEVNEVLTAKGTSENDVELSELDQTIKTLSPFEMVKELFIDSKADKKPKKIPAIRRINDLQVVLYLAYKFFEWEMNPVHETALRKKQKFAKALALDGDNQTTKFKILKYNQSSEQFEIQTGTTTKTAKKILLEDSQSITVINEGLNIKEPESIIEKLTDEYPDKQIEDLSDHLRARHILCDITSEELRDPAKKSYVEKYIKLLARNLEMEFVGENNPENIENNQLSVEWPSQNTSFPKITLRGLYDNVRIEIQLVTKDLQEITDAIDSPLHHEKFYKRLLKLRIGRRLIPESLIPNLHTKITEEIKEIEEQREKAKNGAKQYYNKHA